MAVVTVSMADFGSCKRLSRGQFYTFKLCHALSNIYIYAYLPGQPSGETSGELKAVTDPYLVQEL